MIPQCDWLCDVCGCVMSPTSGIYWVELGFINNYKEFDLVGFLNKKKKKKKCHLCFQPNSFYSQYFQCVSSFKKQNVLQLFIKDCIVNKKYFISLIWPYFTFKRAPLNEKNNYQKIFYFKTNGVLLSSLDTCSSYLYSKTHLYWI